MKIQFVDIKSEIEKEMKGQTKAMLACILAVASELDAEERKALVENVRQVGQAAKEQFDELAMKLERGFVAFDAAA